MSPNKLDEYINNLKNIDDFKEQIGNLKASDILSLKDFINRRKRELTKNIDSLLDAATSYHQKVCEHKWVHVCEYDDKYTYCRMCNLII
jgi:hypothetical protein